MTASDSSNPVTGFKKQQNSSIFSAAAATRRIDVLFRAMSTDFLLREQFVTDPSQVVSEYVYGSRLPAETASIRNQLLYAVMSNHRLLGWLESYATQNNRRLPGADKFVKDFGNAVVQYGGHHIVLALIRASTEKEALNIEEALLPVIFSFFNRGGGAFVSGTEMSTGTNFGTERSGTEMSTGSIFAAGTEMSTGTDFGTERSGTEMSTGSIFAAGTEMSTGTDFGTERSGTEMSTGSIFAPGPIFGGIFALGTEMSTGTDFGTERSGTEMSTGRGFAPYHILVSLEALAQYAGQLKDAGALNTFRSE
jgi:hypothetical protein